MEETKKNIKRLLRGAGGRHSDLAEGAEHGQGSDEYESQQPLTTCAGSQQTEQSKGWEVFSVPGEVPTHSDTAVDT